MLKSYYVQASSSKRCYRKAFIDIPQFEKKVTFFPVKMRSKIGNILAVNHSVLLGYSLPSAQCLSHQK